MILRSLLIVATSKVFWFITRASSEPTCAAKLFNLFGRHTIFRKFDASRRILLKYLKHIFLVLVFWDNVALFKNLQHPADVSRQFYGGVIKAPFCSSFFFIWVELPATRLFHMEFQLPATRNLSRLVLLEIPATRLFSIGRTFSNSTFS